MPSLWNKIRQLWSKRRHEWRNRARFTKHLDKLLHKGEIETLALICFSVNDFSRINHIYSHSVADTLLVKLSNRLREQLPPEVLYGRLAGNCFVIAIPGVDTTAQVDPYIKTLESIVAPRIQLDEMTFELRLSMGIAFCPADSEDSEELIKKADLAMYEARDNPQQRFQYYAGGMDDKIKHRHEILDILRDSLRNKYFYCEFQPQYTIDTHELAGAEALLRLNHPQHGSFPPNEIIPIAAESGLIIPLGYWVINQACEFLQTHEQYLPQGFSLAVNLASAQFHQPNFLQRLEQILKDYSFNPQFLEFEITERTAMQDIDFVMNTMKTVSDMGIKISIDDFGTGYSSIEYLQRFPAQTIKIDRSYITNIAANPGNQSIVEAVVHLAQSFELKVLAEGVETEAELDVVRELGCHEIQGYYFSRPLHLDVFSDLVKKAEAKKA